LFISLGACYNLYHKVVESYHSRWNFFLVDVASGTINPTPIDVIQFPKSWEGSGSSIDEAVLAAKSLEALTAIGSKYWL
jgi:hypothetical protein